ncbi:hypothetical protein GCM10022244_30100 [Streptomyces gulbargensis]|uniref:Uncharacterized protein n=1 Tax=Streptomyces gulbargensis TaxID=364901 RepID=A0ABP7MEV3_9ACTN
MAEEAPEEITEVIRDLRLCRVAVGAGGEPRVRGAVPVLRSGGRCTAGLPAVVAAVLPAPPAGAWGVPPDRASDRRWASVSLVPVAECVSPSRFRLGTVT